MLEFKAYHNSQDLDCRSPFGAVSVGTAISLKIKLETTEQNVSCNLMLYDHLGKELLLPMELMEIGQGGKDDKYHFVIAFQTPADPGLLWYYFQLSIDGQVFYYGNNPEKLGGIGRLSRESPVPYQITVFLPVGIPTWFKEGVMYQIFPDRFHRGKDYLALANKENLSKDPTKKDALLHINWDDSPFYFKDEEGRVNRWSFFGGNLQGLIEKLDYLEGLGVSILYLNPIFLSPSNHKYDTSDYFKIDPLFGDEEIFKLLINETQKRGISIILDGVFSHTGSDSIYFNKEGNFPGLGAFQSEESPYYSWYFFNEYPYRYRSWWGVDALPDANKLESSFQKFIYDSPDSVVRYWLRAGAKGWRLDVADELPGEFIKGIKKALKEEKTDGVLIGEVWEDASNKISYGELREYFWGKELDSVMNYPLRKIWLDFLLGEINGEKAHRYILNLYENYPRENFYAAMNLISSHDRMRALTVLGEGPDEKTPTDQERANYRLSEEARALAVKRMKLLVLLQMTFPGVPCIYYGDEAGLEGYSDPYNRGTYPWGKEDRELLEWHRRMIAFRKEYPLFIKGSFRSTYFEDDIYGFFREGSEGIIVVLINRNLKEERLVSIPVGDWGKVLDRFRVLDLLAGEKLGLEEIQSFKISPLGARIVFLEKLVNPDYQAKKLPRGGGTLLSITSLPSPWGVGDLGRNAYRFIDFLAETKQKVWQILPIQILDEYNSPYYSISSFAANDLLLDVEQMVQLGLLEEGEILEVLKNFQVDLVGGRKGFMFAADFKELLYRKAFTRFNQFEKDYLQFKEENAFWLSDYCLYRALKKEFNQLPRSAWEKGIAKREQGSLNYYRKKLSYEIEYHGFLQYLFDLQWGKLKQYANEKGIFIMGDLPMYVAPDSCDTWVNPELFSLDEDGIPSKIAGVPPDYFSETGQLWGNPTYQWRNHEKNQYLWWLERIKTALKRLDYLRLDHFRGFESYWEIPKDADNAAFGSWQKGPGRRFFQQLFKDLGPLPIIVEDLGSLSPEVSNLKNSFNLPGMKVLQFSGEEMLEDGAYDGIYYTGTHDNNTLLGWYRKHQEQADKFLGLKEGKELFLGKVGREEEIHNCRWIIEYLYLSKAPWVIIPFQDLLCLGNEARMNTPGTTKGNWQWSFDWEQISNDLAPWLRKLMKASDRE